MNNVPENIHYRVSRALKGSYRVKTVLFWSIAILIIGIALIALISVNAYIGMAMAVLIVPTLWFVTKLLAPYIGIGQDFEYTIADKGTFTITYLFRNRRVQKAQCKVKDMKRIAPYAKGDASIQAAVKECKNVYEMLPDMTAPSEYAYYALFDNEKGEPCAAIFELSPSILKAFVYYNSANTVKKDF